MTLVISVCGYKCQFNFLCGLRLSDELHRLVLSYDNKYLSGRMLFVLIAVVPPCLPEPPAPRVRLAFPQVLWSGGFPIPSHPPE